MIARASVRSAGQRLQRRDGASACRSDVAAKVEHRRRHDALTAQCFSAQWWVGAAAVALPPFVRIPTYLTVTFDTMTWSWAALCSRDA